MLFRSVVLMTREGKQGTTAHNKENSPELSRNKLLMKSDGEDVGDRWGRTVRTAPPPMKVVPSDLHGEKMSDAVPGR